MIRRQLQRRFICITMTAVAAVLLLLSLCVNAANLISVNSDLKSTLRMIYHNAGTIPNQPGKTQPQGAPPDFFNSETPFSTRYFVLRYTSTGDLTSANLGHIAAVTEADTAPYLAKALDHGAGFGYTGGYKFYVAETGGGRCMAIFLDCSQQARSVRKLALWSLAADLVCLLLVYLLVTLFSRRAIAPVVRSAAQQKQFITDASHELKTPLTVLTTSLRVLEMEVGPQKWIDKARLQAEKMAALVNDLVTLSRLDEEKPPLTLTDLDLSQVVADAAAPFADAAAQAGHSLCCTIPSGLRLHGDAGAIGQLVGIFLDNALKYTTPGGEITLALRPIRGGVLLCFANPCQPMPPEQVAQFFHRFYRADDARGSGGFGIGLSIARSIAQAHRGDATAVCPTPGMIRFTVTLRSI